MTRMNEIQANAMARYVQILRPDWDFHGVRAALLKLDVDALVAPWIACQCAGDPTAKTPGAMSNPVYRTKEEPAPANTVPSVGRDNVIRLRREQAALADTAASPERIAAIRAMSKFPRKPPEGNPA